MLKNYFINNASDKLARFLKGFEFGYLCFATESRARSRIKVLKKNCDVYLISPDTRYRVVRFGDLFYIMDSAEFEKFLCYLKG